LQEISREGLAEKLKKAGVGGSIPSLATIYQALADDEKRVWFQLVPNSQTASAAAARFLPRKKDLRYDAGKGTKALPPPRCSQPSGRLRSPLSETTGWRNGCQSSPLADGVGGSIGRGSSSSAFPQSQK